MRTPASSSATGSTEELKLAALNLDSEGADSDGDTEEDNPTDSKRATKPAPLDAKAARKANKAAVKAEARAKRSGGGMVLKECDLCSTERDILFRCTVDESQAWKMVCKRCWPGVSGGVSDGDAAHPHYKYGGTWKLHKR
ncbi:MAG: hypothetical protein WDW36_004961 [Sanguina aurantia]